MTFVSKMCDSMFLLCMAAPFCSVGQITMQATPNSSSVSLWEPVFVTVTLENLRDADISLHLGGDGTEAFVWRVTDPSGKQGVYRFTETLRFARAGDYMYPLIKRAIPKHGTLEHAVILNERGGFSVPGVHHVVLEFGPYHLISQFDVWVGSRDEQRLREVCEQFSRLVRTAPGEERDVAQRAFETVAPHCPFSVLAEAAQADPDDTIATTALRDIGTVEAAEVLMTLLPARRGLYRLLVRSSLELIAKRTRDVALRSRIQSVLASVPKTPDEQ